VERKANAFDLLGENDIGLPVIYSEHLTGDGQEMFDHAAKLNFEGIVSKNAEAPYRSDRNEGWLKIKTVQKGKFPVIASSRIRPGWPRCISESAREKTLSTWARSGPAGRGTVSRPDQKQALIPVVSPKSKLTKPVKKPKAMGRADVLRDVEYRSRPCPCRQGLFPRAFPRYSAATPVGSLTKP